MNITRIISLLILFFLVMCDKKRGKENEKYYQNIYTLIRRSLFKIIEKYYEEYDFWNIHKNVNPGHL